MKSLLPLLAAGPAAALLALASPMAVQAQPAAPAADAGPHGDWTLKEREDWLFDRLNRSRDDGSLDHHEYDRVHDQIDTIKDDEQHMRDHHDGQLTDNETHDLEARLDDVADHIQWLHQDAFRRPLVRRADRPLARGARLR
ncbi:MAG: hypothetical protein WDM92_08945 [Caulobacteraceae bacterium]